MDHKIKTKIKENFKILTQAMERKSSIGMKRLREEKNNVGKLNW
jgi:hypothetical protein